MFDTNTKYWVELFQKAIEEDFKVESEKIVEKTKKELETLLDGVVKNIINRFIGNVYFNYGKDPIYNRPQINISFKLFEEEK
jgi:hypothetical protein